MAQSITNPLTIAYIGDAVYALYIRRRLAELSAAPVGVLHKTSSNLVCAEAQYRAAQAIMPLLTEEELHIFKWGRNAKSATVPKHAAVLHYRHATGLEALVGFLYMEERKERLSFIMGKIFDFLYPQAS
ncbi:MAG: ribonuclease III domain-containing protein [Clostridia bacterium]|nr:ribonuclease III domain-containing protein [Clostridia bacterium]